MVSLETNLKLDPAEIASGQLGAVTSAAINNQFYLALPDLVYFPEVVCQLAVVRTTVYNLNIENIQT